MKRILIGIAIWIIAFSGSSYAAKKLSPQELAAACEKAKRAGNYDTPDGRAYAKSLCVKNGSTSAIFWKERARQQACVEKTGKVCQD